VEREGLADHYYLDLAAAFVRGRLGSLQGDGPQDAFVAGLEAGLRLHKFKRTAGLPRVQRVLGILRGIAPETLVDIGSGRGVFLWPLLDAFPHLPVTAIDVDPQRVADLRAVQAGGVSRLTAACMNAERLELPAASADVVTALEVLEHVADVQRAAGEIMRVARRFVVVSVPSKPDDNPQHIRLFSEQSLQALLRAAGAAKVTVDYVPNHMIAVARIGDGAAAP
jgi:ubiquinone/menaquinone biosynthesis C-methylase UbiE